MPGPSCPFPNEEKPRHALAGGGLVGRSHDGKECTCEKCPWLRGPAQCTPRLTQIDSVVADQQSRASSQLSIRWRRPLHFHHLSHHHLHPIQSCRALQQGLCGGSRCGVQIMQGLPRVAGEVREVQEMQVASMVQGSIQEFFLFGHD